METRDVRQETQSHEPSPVSDFALWTSVLSGPVLFLLNLEVNYAMVDWACNTGHAWALSVAHVVALTLTIAGTGLGVVLWRRLGSTWPDTNGGAASRARLLAAVGALGGALFAINIVAHWVPVVVIGACLRS